MKEFSKLELLQEHSVVHSRGKKIFECNYCPRKFRYKSYLKKHETHVHFHKQEKNSETQNDDGGEESDKTSQ